MTTARVIYDGPLHQRIVDPTEEQLRDLIHATDEEYWLAGSGDAELRFASEGNDSCLGMKKLAPLGLCLFFKGASDDEMLVSCSGDESDEIVPVFFCGEYTDEPVAHFVDADTAYEASVEFCKTGLRPTKIRWEKWPE